MNFAQPCIGHGHKGIAGTHPVCAAIMPCSSWQSGGHMHNQDAFLFVATLFDGNSVPEPFDDSGLGSSRFRKGGRSNYLARTAIGNPEQDFSSAFIG